MFSEAKVTEIYCLADDFCKEFAKYQENHMLPTVHKSGSIVISPIIWVMPKSCWSWFYSIPVDTDASNISIWNMCVNTWHICFPGKYPTTVFWIGKGSLVSFDHIHQTVLIGRCTAISFVDSTPLRVCRNQRIHIHKTFEGLATRGKCSMGWFFGFKLYLIINDKGEILNFMFTSTDVDDRQPLKQGSFLNNMKNVLMNINDKILIRKRAVIETVNDELKTIA